jgi:predicted dehydrogenase
MTSIRAVSEQRDASRTLRVGIIGAGEIVRSIHLPVLRMIPRTEVAWVMDVNEAKARDLAQSFGIPGAHASLDRCTDVDAVLLATPVGARDDAWRRAFDAKWNVFCEKPVATTAEEFDWIADSMRDNDRTLGVGLMRRYYAGTLLLQRLIRDRVFGDPIEIWTAEGGRQTRSGKDTDWYQFDRSLAGGGVLIETGSHLIDQVMFVSGATGYELESYRQRPQGHVMEFDARAEGVLVLPHRGRVPFTAIISRATDVCNGIYVRFSNVVLALLPGADGAVQLRTIDNAIIARLDGGAGVTNSYTAFHAEWTEFLQQCRSGDLNDEAIALTRLSVALIADCYEREGTRAEAVR